MKRIQQLHLWLGTVFAPMIIFFALTGALQTFSLHEGPPGSSPGWIAALAQIHKNQRLSSPRQGRPEAPQTRGAQAAKPEGEGQKPEGARPEGARSSGPSSLPLKIFVTLMSVGLIVTTLLGIWMAFKYSRDKRIVWALLLIGTILPVALLFI